MFLYIYDHNIPMLHKLIISWYIATLYLCRTPLVELTMFSTPSHRLGKERKEPPMHLSRRHVCTASISASHFRFPTKN